MSPADPQHAIGQSETFMLLQERISRAAKTERPVIFIGERGTGKELAAARLHLLSARWNQPYVTINCASLPPTLIESELFGHEAGAFTGATRLRKGRFEMADGGTLFLDEIGNIPMTVQEKILRTVEYGKMERVGSSTTMTVDARLVAAANVDLRAQADAGRFRQDLLDRLSFEVIVLPPLRARREDIMPLAEHFARRMASELGREEAPEIGERARQALLAYAWPGNVRELKNVIERMAYRSEGGVIEEIVFDPFESPWMPTATAPLSGEDAAQETEAAGQGAGRDATESSPRVRRAQADGAEETAPLSEAVRALELRRVRKALVEARFNQRQAATLLGLTYHQFRGYYRKYQDDLVD
jgi:psp operon transcriptional activator